MLRPNLRIKHRLNDQQWLLDFVMTFSCEWCREETGNKIKEHVFIFSFKKKKGFFLF